MEGGCGGGTEGSGRVERGKVERGTALEADGLKGGCLVGEENAVAEEGGVAGQGLFGGEAGEFGRVVGFGEVTEDDGVSSAVVVVLEEFGGGGVREVAYAGEDALLDGPGVRAVAEHFEIVIGLEEEDVDALEGGFDVGGHVAQVGGDGHADAFGGKDEAAGVGGVVGDGEGGDLEIADRKVFACPEVLDCGKVGGIGLFFRRGAEGERLVAVFIDGKLEGSVRIFGTESFGTDILGTDPFRTDIFGTGRGAGS